MLLKFQLRFVHPHIALKFNFEKHYFYTNIIAIKQVRERVISYIKHCGKSLAVLEEYTHTHTHTFTQSFSIILGSLQEDDKITLNW